MSVMIIIGSESDYTTMSETAKMLDELGITYRFEIASAHRSPEKVLRLIREAEKDGVNVIIAGAGMAAHLPGFIASRTLLPVIGVPLDSSPLNGFDSLLSIVQMPPGIPVATVSIGKAGAKNAAILAAEILARKDSKIEKRLRTYREEMAEQIEKKTIEDLKKK